MSPARPTWCSPRTDASTCWSTTWATTGRWCASALGRPRPGTPCTASTSCTCSRSPTRSSSPMIAGGGGSIVNVHSVEGMRGYPGDPIYGAMKAAVATLHHRPRRLPGRNGIRVNGIGPDLTHPPGRLPHRLRGARPPVGVVGAGRAPRLARGPGPRRAVPGLRPVVVRDRSQRARRRRHHGRRRLVLLAERGPLREPPEGPLTGCGRLAPSAPECGRARAINEDGGEVPSGERTPESHPVNCGARVSGGAERRARWWGKRHGHECDAVGGQRAARDTRTTHPGAAVVDDIGPSGVVNQLRTTSWRSIEPSNRFPRTSLSKSQRSPI